MTYILILFSFFLTTSKNYFSPFNLSRATSLENYDFEGEVKVEEELYLLPFCKKTSSILSPSKHNHISDKI